MLVLDKVGLHLVNVAILVGQEGLFAIGAVLVGMVLVLHGIVARSRSQIVVAPLFWQIFAHSHDLVLYLQVLADYGGCKIAVVVCLVQFAEML